MSPSLFLDGRVSLFAGDCRAVLAGLSENSIDSCVTDPPYHLTAGKKGGSGVASDNPNSPAGRSRITTGFMGKAWDGGDIAFRPETWTAVLRVLKPGAHLLAFGAPRNFHRLACAIEDAGFELRDTIMWIFGQGFPKSLDVSKAIDKSLGAEREQVTPRSIIGHQRNIGNRRPWMDDPDHKTDSDDPATAAAAAWEGWGTALKPAFEPIILARKPLSEGTVAANVLRWGTGAININGCRVGADGGTKRSHQAEYARHKDGREDRSEHWARTGHEVVDLRSGRWPANLIHDGSDEVVEMFPESSVTGDRSARSRAADVSGTAWGNRNHESQEHLDSGSAARFFYSAKADQQDRIGSKHPTIKPVDLMQYLVRLVTPPKGVILDPFAGTGTTGEAAWREGFSATLIEQEAAHCADIERRMSLCLAGPAERKREIAKARGRKPDDDAPLFAEAIPA